MTFGNIHLSRQCIKLNCIEKLLKSLLKSNQQNSIYEIYLAEQEEKQTVSNLSVYCPNCNIP